MKIIALLNEKGGAGKSTCAINLACALHRAGRKVVLVDADPQGTARDWREASPADVDLPPVVPLDRPEVLLASIKTLAADVAIIDTPANRQAMPDADPSRWVSREGLAGTLAFLLSDAARDIHGTHLVVSGLC